MIRGSVATPDRDGVPAQAHADGREAGLTLVETIVALALAALVVAFLAQGAGLLRHFAHLGRAVSAQDETLAMRDHLRRTLESVMSQGGSTHRDYLAGVTDKAVFTVPGDPLLESGGLVRITLGVVAEARGVSLVETRDPLGTSKRDGRTRRLIAGASHVQFFYFSNVGGNSPTWLSEWTDPGSGPSLMRIDLAFPPGDSRQWPPFIVYMPTGDIPPNPPNTPARAEPVKPAGAG